MALFPTDAKDGEIFAADNGKNYVYQEEKNVWQSTDCVPKWSDQVYIRGVVNRTQQNVNDTNQEVNVKVGNVATATNQLLDVAFDVRCRGIWIYQGGAVAPGDPPVGLQRFLMTDAEGEKTQEYSEAASLTIHAMGAGKLDKISIGETEVGDLITIQNSSDLGGGSYIVTAIEEFHNDNPDELTETYAVYTVVADTKRCSGSIATEEKAVIRIIPQQAVPAFEDSEYLKRNQSNDVTTGFPDQIRQQHTGFNQWEQAGALQPQHTDQCKSCRQSGLPARQLLKAGRWNHDRCAGLYQAGRDCLRKVHFLL